MMKQAPWIKQGASDPLPSQGDGDKLKGDGLRRHYDDAAGVINRRRVVARRIVGAPNRAAGVAWNDQVKAFREAPEYLRDDAVERVRRELAARMKDAAKADLLIKGALLLIERGANLDEAVDFARSDA